MRFSGSHRGIGSVIQVRPVRGLGQLNNPRSAVGAAMPVVLGAGTAALTTIGIRQFMMPTTPGQMKVVEYAPWIGMGAGTLTSLALWNMASVPAGISSLAAALTVGIGYVIAEAAAKMRPMSTAPVAGLRAVVPEYSLRGLPAGGVGAIALEPLADRGYGAGPVGRLSSYGEVVNLGQINAGAFGTPTFTLGRSQGRYGGRRR